MNSIQDETSIPRMHMRAYDAVLHGLSIRYTRAGSGPAIVLLHGITHSSNTWSAVLEELSQHFTVIAPDFLGHGGSDKPQGDYSLGEYASMLRDLLVLLDLPRVTLIGHSLGGGVAMQFVYQFPEMCERLVLVSSGGLGRDLNPLIRLATMPGTELLMPWLCSSGFSTTIASIARILSLAGLRGGTDVREFWRGYLSLLDPGSRRAFLLTMRGLIDVHGQRVSALNRLYLAEQLPTLIIWGESDALIPAEHARVAHAALVNSQLAIFPGAGHFPHIDCPERFVTTLTKFMRTTAPAQLDAAHFCTLAQRRNGSLLQRQRSSGTHLLN